MFERHIQLLNKERGPEELHSAIVILYNMNLAHKFPPQMIKQAQIAKYLLLHSQEKEAKEWAYEKCCIPEIKKSMSPQP
jgi:hypothetical protein